MNDTIEVTIRQAGARMRKGDQHIISAGLLLWDAKQRYDAGEWTETYESFETLGRRFGGIGISRGKELIAIASGRTTVEEVRAKSNQRDKKRREKQSAVAHGQKLTSRKTKESCPKHKALLKRIVDHLRHLSPPALQQAAKKLGVEL